MAYYRKRDNGWEYRISYKDIDGKYKQKSKSGFKTKALASAAASKAELELLSGTPVTNKDITFSQYFKEWVDTHKRPSSAIGTIKGYEVTQQALDKYFKILKLRDITPTMYQKTLNKMGEHYAKNTLHKHHHKFRACVKHAIADGIIEKNFTDLAKINSVVQGKTIEENYLEEDEYLRLIDYLYSDPFKYRNIQMYLLAVTGMRVGESMGLTWNDIDLENGIIDINKTWDIVRNDRFAPTKNQQSIRQIPINAKLIDLLKEYRANHWKDNQHNRLFPQVATAYLNKRIKVYVGRSVHIHSLRHTYVSYLVSKGIELLTISQLIGHKDLTVTLQTYTHLLENKKISDYSKIKKLF